MLKSGPTAKKKSRRSPRIESTSQAGQVYKKFLRALTLRVLKTQGWDYDLDIIITGDEELRRLHCAFYSDDSITDVMAFPGDERAEIYLNLDEARRQAASDRETLLKALSRLLIHGVLHLGGWRDHTGAQRKRMLQHGERLLSELVDPTG